MDLSKLERIGKGTFTTCYRLNKKEVILETTDHVKECMSFGWGFDSSVFPTIEYVDEGVYCPKFDTNNKLYKSKYYPKVRSLKTALRPQQYELYKELRRLSIDIPQRDCEFADEWRKAFKTVSNKRMREALLEAVDGLGNYGCDVRFEISPRNVAVYRGRLVLLDCFFLKSQLEVALKAKSRGYVY